METVLLPQAYPVAMMDGFVQKGEISIIMQCHDGAFTDVEVRNESGELLFTVESKAAGSWSWRRIVKDATDTPLFHFRKHVSRDRPWTVESPSGREMCYMRGGASMRQAKPIEVMVWNLEDKGNEAIFETQPKDESGITTLVNFGGATVAEIQLIKENLTRFPRTVWRARITGGVDLALIIAIMLCRAEGRHVYRH